MEPESLINVNRFFNVKSQKSLEKSSFEVYHFPIYKNNENSHSQLTSLF